MTKFLDKYFPDEDLQNLWYLLKHKYYIIGPGKELGVPLGQVLKHDLSKLLPSEEIPYANYFFEKRTPATKKAFLKAILLHYSRNKHHPAYWKMKGLEMPTKYKLEMLADHYAAGKARGRISSKTFDQWLKQHKITKTAGIPMNTFMGGLAGMAIGSLNDKPLTGALIGSGLIGGLTYLARYGHRGDMKKFVKLLKEFKKSGSSGKILKGI